ncbi:MAG: hypothetical protein EB120_13030 [Proteobacteria bacterium]|nr:hypothetical protein [Pseudomonadota bacterium]
MDWSRQMLDIPVQNPKAESFIIQAGEQKVVFDGTRATTIGVNTQFDVTMVDANGRYRITWTGGDDPGLRTSRSVNLTGIEILLNALANKSLVVTASTGTPFSSVQAGDQVYIAPGEFSSANEGFWSVLASTGNTLTLVRFSGEDFLAVTETVTPTTSASFRVFASSGVQPGDKVDITTSFAPALRRTFRVEAVTNSWFEIFSTSALPAQSGIQPGSGMKFYTSSKKYLRVEVDQECVVRVNSDTSDNNRVSPWVAGDSKYVGEYSKAGPAWALTIINKSSVALNVIVLSAE